MNSLFILIFFLRGTSVLKIQVDVFFSKEKRILCIFCLTLVILPIYIDITFCQKCSIIHFADRFEPC